MTIETPSETTPTQPLRTRGNRSRARKGGYFLRDILVIFVVALLASTLIKTFLVQSFYIPSGSMQNTLQIQDRVMVNKLVPGLIGLQHGDVVVFKDPGGWLDNQPSQSSSGGNPVSDAIGWVLAEVGLGAQDSNDHLIKRVIGLPGDKVVCCNPLGQTTVNDVPLNEPYTKDPLSMIKVVPFSVTVPAGSIWVEGDNRNNSFDSRYHLNLPGGGFVPLSDIVGRAVIITWPVNRWSELDDYPSTFQAVGSAG